MKKLYQIVFYFRRGGGAVAYESKILFENDETAQQVADHICKEKGLFFKLVEYYL